MKIPKLYLFKANFLEFFSNVFLIFLSLIIISNLLDKLAISLGLHKYPLKLLIIASLHPGTLVVTIAHPDPLASIKDFGNPSRYDGRHTIELSLKSL